MSTNSWTPHVQANKPRGVITLGSQQKVKICPSAPTPASCQTHWRVRVPADHFMRPTYPETPPTNSFPASQTHFSQFPP